MIKPWIGSGEFDTGNRSEQLIGEEEEECESTEEDEDALPVGYAHCDQAQLVPNPFNNDMKHRTFMLKYLHADQWF